jgi:selenocysteine-specific elongation factor
LTATSGAAEVRGASGGETPLRPLTLGTAGHIDHGKTTLVKALTGRDTDRLKEEKERGISIELGFAELLLPSGRRLSVVDVPGHERFVKTMVAGATGIDLFLLVVAADDGVMPQTREHLRIIELLGVPAGVVALTKIDMVDRDLAELARTEVEEFLASSRYADAPIVMVSGVTGEGLSELLAALERVGASVPARAAYPATRMPIDRVFSLKGIGTVVTGTLWSGALAAEDLVAVLPPRQGRGRTVRAVLRRGAGNRVSAGLLEGSRMVPGIKEIRVRSVQVHDREVPLAVGGQRVALNLSGVDRDEVVRGQWVVKDPVIEPTYLADVRLELLADAPAPLPRVMRARVDHGTAELLVKVVLADRETLAPGETCYAQLRFEEPALLYPGDQFILRSLTPVTTIGGGRVIDPAARKHGTGAQWNERLRLLEEGDPEAVAQLLLEEAFPYPLLRRRLEGSPYLWRSSETEVKAAVARLLKHGRAVVAGEVGGGDSRLFSGPRLGALEETVLAAVRKRAASDPLDPYLTVGDLRREVAGGRESPALEAALEDLQKTGEVVRTEHGFRWKEALAVPEAGGGADVLRLLEQFAGSSGEGGSGPMAETPSVTQAAATVGMDGREAQRIVEALVKQGRLVRVGEDLYYPPDRLQALIERLTTAMEAAGQLTLAEARDLLGTSRKYAQALLEHMDSEGLTLRVGDTRRLRRRRK